VIGPSDYTACADDNSAKIIPVTSDKIITILQLVGVPRSRLARNRYNTFLDRNCKPVEDDCKCHRIVFWPDVVGDGLVVGSNCEKAFSHRY